MADRVGFEPTVRFWRTHTFQACAFDHSATCPQKLISAGGGKRAPYSGNGRVFNLEIDSRR